MGSIVNPNNYPAKENVVTILVVALAWAVFGVYIPESSLFLLIGVFILVLIGVSLLYRNPLDVIILSAVGIIFFISFVWIFSEDESPRFILMRTAALSAFFLLGFVLMIGPLPAYPPLFSACINTVVISVSPYSSLGLFT